MASGSPSRPSSQIPREPEHEPRPTRDHMCVASNLRVKSVTGTSTGSRSRPKAQAASVPFPEAGRESRILKRFEGRDDAGKTVRVDVRFSLDPSVGDPPSTAIDTTPRLATIRSFEVQTSGHWSARGTGMATCSTRAGSPSLSRSRYGRMASSMRWWARSSSNGFPVTSRSPRLAEAGVWNPDRHRASHRSWRRQAACARGYGPGKARHRHLIRAVLPSRSGFARPGPPGPSLHRPSLPYRAPLHPRPGPLSRRRAYPRCVTNESVVDMVRRQPGARSVSAARRCSHARALRHADGCPPDRAQTGCGTE